MEDDDIHKGFRDAYHIIMQKIAYEACHDCLLDAVCSNVCEKYRNISTKIWRDERDGNNK